MQSEEEFIEAICQDPDDDRLRSIYADWLEDNEIGDGKREAKANFIRSQVALVSGQENGGPMSDEHHPALQAEAQELLAKHSAEWEQPLRDLGATRIIFRRGLPERLAISAQEFQANAGRLFRLAPVRTLRVWNLGDEEMRVLAQSPHLQHLRTLDLAGNGIREAGARALAQSPDLQHLTSLNLAHNEIGEAGARALAQSPYLRHLTTLSLGYNGIGDAGARALAQSSYLANLTRLDLEYNDIGKAVLHEIKGLVQARRRTSGE